MAKKAVRGAKKKAAKASGSRRQSKKEIAKLLTKGPIRRPPARPKAAPLPGMEDMAEIKSLDRICDSLADVRSQANDLKQQESGLLSNALREMRTHSRHMYRAHGVELVRKAGEEKIQFHLTKAQGTVAPDVDSDEHDIDTDVYNGAGNESTGGGVFADA